MATTFMSLLTTVQRKRIRSTPALAPSKFYRFMCEAGHVVMYVFSHGRLEYLWLQPLHFFVIFHFVDVQARRHEVLAFKFSPCLLAHQCVLEYC